jgi:glyoxylase-like metal-dependent hydrolase (beta-lactamase superfamily II)
MEQLTTIDLGFQGFSEVIAAFVAPTGHGRFVLFESGPASSVEAVGRAVADLGLTIDGLEGIFATHVHLDHAGGAGVLARRTGCTVYAHPAGAAHLVDPGAKLLPSAERLYGDMLEPLWGSTEGVPSGQLETVGHGQEIRVGELEVVAWHTPGHAVHHIVWQIGRDVVMGDVGGIRFPGAEHVAPPMPPPDIDVPAWRESLDLVRRMSPDRLLLAHFGAFGDPERHLHELEERLLRWTSIASDVVARGGRREDLAKELGELEERELGDEELPEDVISRYRKLCPMPENSAGLYRYVNKRAG